MKCSWIIPILASSVLIGIVHSLPAKVRQNDIHKTVGKPAKEIGSVSQRMARANLHKLTLNDPLDCLSQVVCGMNTYPPEKPSVRTSTANDFAFLLKNSIAKLRSQKIPVKTTTTAAPATTKKTAAPKVVKNDDEEDDDEDYDEDDVDNDVEYENNNEYYSDDVSRRQRTRGKRASVFSSRRGLKKKKKKQSSNKKLPANMNWSELIEHLKRKKASSPRPLTPLDRLRMETDLRAKLLSDAQCVNGLLDHACPFNYQQMLALMSSSLERERTISYSTNKVLPMVGYLIKSRNYTGTLSATFTAIERINNYTIEADKEGKPIDFSHILDEVLNRNTGDNGLRIVDTSNDSASDSVWEDDEFDHVLQNPYVRRKPDSENYKLPEKKKKKKQKTPLEIAVALLSVSTSTAAPGKEEEDDAAENDDDTTSEEDTSEEGLVFDRPRPPLRGPPDQEDHHSSSEEDDQTQDHADEVFEEDKDAKKKNALLAPPPVFGHIRKSAEDE